ncbi:hypothetical protein [Streptomyces sp. SCSIO ZS0520]|uniref:hypothetical protein n=1 Tax=Streptomyces sp. SCSIO ZS0520 TaxID=2892996 RepID=UPI0039863A3A
MRRPRGPAGPQHGHPVPVSPEAGQDPPRRPPQQRKQVLLRLDPQVYEALARWAGEELRSANAQIEFLLRRALAETGRLPGTAGPIRGRGRPRKAEGGSPERGTGTADGQPEADGSGG